jgi:hypothetical protein
MPRKAVDFITLEPNYDTLKPEYVKLTKDQLQKLGADAEALFQLGIRYGYEQQWNEQHRYIVAAAVLKHPVALGYVLLNDCFLERFDRARARSLFIESANRGHGSAMFALGVTYQYRENMFDAKKKSMDMENFMWIQSACLAGCVYALPTLSVYYIEGKIIEKCFPIAVALLRIYYRNGGTRPYFNEAICGAHQYGPFNYSRFAHNNKKISTNEKIIGHLLGNYDNVCSKHCQTASELLCEQNHHTIQLIMQHKPIHSELVLLINNILPLPVAEEIIPELITMQCTTAITKE